MRSPFPPPRPVPTCPDLASGFAALRHRQHRWRQRHAIRRVATAAALLLVLMLGGLSLLAVPALYQSARAYQRVFVEPVPHTDPANAAVPRPAYAGHDRLNILLLGIDRRGDEPPRSDTMLLVSIDLVSERAAIVSLPRDLRVLVPGYGVQKLNAAYAFGAANDVPGGGPGLAIRTIEDNFGLPVDHFVEIDFTGFVQMIDLAGGLTIDVPAAFRDDAFPTPDYGVTTIAFAAGPQRMDGERALVYARTRHADGDLRRTERQRQVLLALRDQADVASLLPQAPALMASLGDSVRTDLSPALALDLARLAARLSPEAITEHPLDPILTPILDQTGDEFLIPDWHALGEILSRATGATILPPAVTNPSLRRALELPSVDAAPLDESYPALWRRLPLRAREHTVVSTNRLPRKGNDACHAPLSTQHPSSFRDIEESNVSQTSRFRRADTSTPLGMTAGGARAAPDSIKSEIRFHRNSADTY